jgi:hypothetical protein
VFFRFLGVGLFLFPSSVALARGCDKMYVLTHFAGNKYSIENVLDKPARIFFSQGSEAVPET